MPPLQAERRFQEVEDAINSGNHDQALVSHGLSGSQLELKTTLADRAIDAVEGTDDKVFMRRKTPPRILGRGPQAADVIGGSLKRTSTAPALSRLSGRGSLSSEG
jgi:hypothetical protein